MRFSWKLGRVAGIDLFLHPTFLLLLAFVGTTQGGLIAVALVSAVFGCVLLHELGHALTARFYGIRTEDITLYPIGGVARLSRMPRKPGPELVITLAGPAVNLAIAGAIAAGLAVVGPFWPDHLDTLPLAFLSALIWINLTLAAFNLVPAFPMDGGRVLRAVLSGWLGRLRATEVAAGLGKTLALAFGLWSLTQGQVLHALLAAFIYFAGAAELARVRFEEWDGRGPRGGRVGDDGLAGNRSRWVHVGSGVWLLEPVPVATADYGPGRPWR
jgi:Zn-dependent protease